jgi:hypothetical protein
MNKSQLRENRCVLKIHYMKNYLFFIILCFSFSKLQPILCSKVLGFKEKTGVWLAPGTAIL